MEQSKRIELGQKIEQGRKTIEKTVERASEKGIAIVTGASSGIGKAIAERLVKMGYEVYGIGRSFPEDSHPFHAISCDLLDTEKLLGLMEPLRKSGRVRVLVNNAGLAYYGLHEEQSFKKLQEMLRVNLEVPLLLSQYFLRELKKKQGRIVNISSVTATHASPHAAAYAATKAGLLSFSRSLFEEGRKSGLRVLCILPDLTETELYRNADFTTGEEKNSHLLPEEVADALEYAFSQRAGVNVSEILLRPEKNQIRRKEREGKDSLRPFK